MSVNGIKTLEVKKGDTDTVFVTKAAMGLQGPVWIVGRSNKLVVNFKGSNPAACGLSDHEPSSSLDWWQKDAREGNHRSSEPS